MPSARNPRSRPSQAFQPSMPGWPSTTNRQPTWPASRASGPTKTRSSGGGVDPVRADHQVVGRRRPVIEGDSNAVGAVIDRCHGHTGPDRHARRAVREDPMQLLRDGARSAGATSRQSPASSKSMRLRPVVEEPPPPDHRTLIGDGVCEPELDPAPPSRCRARRSPPRRSAGSWSAPRSRTRARVAGRHGPWPTRRYRHRRSGSSSSPMLLAGRHAPPVVARTLGHGARDRLHRTGRRRPLASEGVLRQGAGLDVTDYGPEYSGIQDPRNPGQEFGGLSPHTPASRAVRQAAAVEGGARRARCRARTRRPRTSPGRCRRDRGGDRRAAGRDAVTLVRRGVEDHAAGAAVAGRRPAPAGRGADDLVELARRPGRRC